MKKLLLILAFSIPLFASSQIQQHGMFYSSVGFSFTEWVSDSDIIDGLTDVGYDSSPTVFTIGTDIYLISGEYKGAFYGWKAE